MHGSKDVVVVACRIVVPPLDPVELGVNALGKTRAPPSSANTASGKVYVVEHP